MAIGLVGTSGTSVQNYSCTIKEDKNSISKTTATEFDDLLYEKSDTSIVADTNDNIDIDFLKIEQRFLYTETDKVAISSFEDYKAARIAYVVKKSTENTKEPENIDEINFEKEFEKYLEYKNCDSVDELSKKTDTLNKLTTKEITIKKYGKGVLLKGQINELTREELQWGYTAVLYSNKMYNPQSSALRVSGLDAEINSLEDFINNYDIINPPSFYEYCNEELNGIKREIDYETEFKNYLASRGCETESELQALNTSGFGNSKWLIEYTNISIGFYLGQSVDPDSLEYILNNLSIEERGDFYNNLKIASMDSTKHIKGAVKNAFKKLLEKFRNNPNVNIDFNKVFSAIDAIVEAMRNPDKVQGQNEPNKNRVSSKQAFYSYNKINLTKYK